MSAESTRQSVDALCIARDVGVVFGSASMGVHALAGIDFDIHRAERVALVGDSGSGKSTLALALARLLPRNARVTGSICFEGREIGALEDQTVRSMRGASIGMVFQDSKSALHPLMRIENQVAETWIAHRRCSGAQALTNARAALAHVGLDADLVARAFPHELSGGMRQRVQIATALALSPALLVLDEPTTALDTVTQKRIFELIERLRAASGFATLLITHDLPLALAWSDRIVRLEHGRIAPSGPLAATARGSASAVRFGLDGAARSNTDRPRKQAENVLETRALSVAYPAQGRLLARRRGPLVVDQVSIALGPGEALALVGSSGSGKTTFVRGLLRLVEPVSGTIEFRRRDGESAIDLRTLDGSALREIRSDLGVVFQDPLTSLDPRQTVSSALREALEVRRVARGEIELSIARLLEDVGLTTAHGARFPHQLSGGEAQRVCLARTFASRPRVLVLDEALSSLDPTIRARMLEQLARLRREEGLACLFVTHDLASVEHFADRVAVMSAGRIVETGATERVFRAPAHAATRELLDARPGSVDRDAEVAPQDRA